MEDKYVETREYRLNTRSKLSRRAGDEWAKLEGYCGSIYFDVDQLHKLAHAALALADWMEGKEQPEVTPRCDAASGADDCRAMAWHSPKRQEPEAKPEPQAAELTPEAVKAAVDTLLHWFGGPVAYEELISEIYRVMGVTAPKPQAPTAELTPEMIAAGMAVLEHGSTKDTWEITLSDIYRAMVAVAPKSPTPPAPETELRAALRGLVEAMTAWVIRVWDSIPAWRARMETWNAEHGTAARTLADALDRADAALKEEDTPVVITDEMVARYRLGQFCVFREKVIEWEKLDGKDRELWRRSLVDAMRVLGQRPLTREMLERAWEAGIVAYTNCLNGYKESCAVGVDAMLTELRKGAA